MHRAPRVHRDGVHFCSEHWTSLLKVPSSLPPTGGADWAGASGPPFKRVSFGRGGSAGRPRSQEARAPTAGPVSGR
jgi:hypothetical protein